MPSYNFTHLTSLVPLHRHKFSQILQPSFQSFQVKGNPPLAASVTELVSLLFPLIGLLVANFTLKVFCLLLYAGGNQTRTELPLRG